jgi:hypothetical protein
MPKLSQKDYLPLEDYREMLGVFQGISGLLLFNFARVQCGSRDIIIRNTIARVNTLAGSVFRLWDAGDADSAYVLYRCIPDRLFHLWHLAERNEFELFEQWSYFEQFNARNKVRSDPDCREALDNPLFSFSEEEIARAKSLAKNPPRWSRPRPEDAAKGLKLGILYRFGYDFASRLVHPMANDGNEDFYRITKLKPAPDFPDQGLVLSNTLLIATMTVQEGLNASHFRWRRVVFDFLDELRRGLDSGSKAYRVPFVKIGRFAKDGAGLGEPSHKATPDA